jgi:CBS domain-containing protein
MGDQKVAAFQSADEKRKFTKCLLNDVRALEEMLAEDRFEHETIRIGAEQELVMVGPDWQPALNYDKILAQIEDPCFTTELARFNLEINLDPHPFKAKVFSELETQLRDKLAKAQAAAERLDTSILLTGILPTISKEHLNFPFMTPNPRYQMLNEMIKGRRNADFELNIKGMDELVTSHPNILFEACNTSFQVHLQVKAHEFTERFNWAQAIAGPMMAAAANSPLLMGRRLWNETRIALFQQSIDLRNTSKIQRDVEPRVSFGRDWLRGGVAELYKESIVQFNTLFSSAFEEDSLAVLAQGATPKLKALCMHNSTVYMWNRACYGISDNGQPHLRIENRYIPAGPTVIDEVANAAFWLGLVMGMPEKYREIDRLMSFDAARFNFYNAAQLGLDANFKWTNNKLRPARKLILEELLPMAMAGLEKMKVSANDIDEYLGVIEGRVDKNQNGANWLLANMTNLLQHANRAEASLALTKALVEMQATDLPVHEWPPLETSLENTTKYYNLAEHVMNHEVATVNQEDLLELVINIMVWRNVRYVAVENDHHELVGLVASRNLLRLLQQGWQPDNLVEDVMARDLITVGPSTPTEVCLRLMVSKNIGCLPVVSDRRLLGLISERDIVKATNSSKKFKRE